MTSRRSCGAGSMFVLSTGDLITKRRQSVFERSHVAPLYSLLEDVLAGFESSWCSRSASLHKLSFALISESLGQ